ncbi:MAG: hypothetical protein ACTSVO_13360 [Candidatus Heimdallarchaeaceae archaeon]
MLKCKHECDHCGEEWECKFPYYSNHQYLEDIIEHGSYCNAYCPICSPIKRENFDALFENVAETGYMKTGNDDLKEKINFNY